MRKIVNLFGKRYAVFLVVLVIVSYGQMLWMYQWQDDNALLFKLAHIDEPAGYFGIGPIGNGLTKYAHTPFIPIYNLFEFNTVFYFALLLALYILATFVVYKSFSLILGENGGKISGFIFAAGYMVSDGIWRMANSVTTTLSIVFIGLFLVGYWKLHKTRSVVWYALALASFFLASEITIVRAHYFFIIVVAFELIFFSFSRLPVSIIFSLFRLLPFFYIFKNWALAASSSRTGLAHDFALAWTNGRFDQYYSFFSSVTNLVIPDWLTNYFFIIQKFADSIAKFHVPLLRAILIVAPVFLFFLMFKKHKLKRILIPLFIALNVVWVWISKELFIAPLLSPTIEQLFIATAGGVILLTFAGVFLVLNNRKWIFLFLLFWMLVNIAVYASYNPHFQYGSVERYMAHSFMALVGIYGLLFLSLPKNIHGNIARGLILVLGLGNLINGVVYENSILRSRSFPARDFYSDLKVLMPSLEKGDILYFDVAQSRLGNYGDAIATAMMPETTAFAWRYGIDRYDIKLTTDFSDLVKIIETDGVLPDSINSFYYSKSGLIDTSSTVRNFFKGIEVPGVSITYDFPLRSNLDLTQTGENTHWNQPEIDLPLMEPVDSSIPIEVELNITASLPKTDDIKYPLISRKAKLTSADKGFWQNSALRNLALEYKIAKELLQKNSEFKVASEWQNNVARNLHDQDINSVWQSERTGWGREFTFIEMELPNVYEIDRAVWVNGYSSNTPVGYRIEVSLDGKLWSEVAYVNDVRKVDGREPQVVPFSRTRARFVRMVLTDTLNGDSPVVAEFWVAPSEFSNLDINFAEKFAKDPLALVPSKQDFLESIAGLRSKGKVQLLWYGNKTENWEGIKQSEFEMYYDGKGHVYKVQIPAGGTEITKLMIGNIDIPGEIKIHSIKIRSPKPLNLEIE